MTKYNKWYNTELTVLKKLYPSATWEEITKALPGRSVLSIRAYASYYKLRRRPLPNILSNDPIIKQLQETVIVKKLSITNLSNLSGIDRSQIHKTFARKSDHVSVGTIRKLAKALGLEIKLMPKG